MKKIILAVFAALLTLTVSAQSDKQKQKVEPDIKGVEESDAQVDDKIESLDMKHWNFDIRAGYSIGGTLPMGFPVEMRALNSFNPKFNYRFGADVEYRFNPRWGLDLGLYFERKGFGADISLRQFNVIMSQGGNEITGPYTGNVVINVTQTGFTVPIQAAWYPKKNIKVKFGGYISYISDRNFHGYAYGEPTANGLTTAYLRRGEIRGDVIYIGNDENTRGTFSGDLFNGFMRQFQAGVTVGCDYYFLRHWGVFLDVSYGVNSAFNNKEGNPVTMGLYPLYATVGIVFKIGR